MASLSSTIATARRTPQMQARMAQLGHDAVGSTAEALTTFQAAEILRTAELVRLSGAKVE